MKKNLNKLLLVAFILGALYVVYLFAYISGAVGSGASDAENAGIAIGAALIMPHLVCSLIAVIFNGLGLFLDKRGFALTGGILYAVAMILMPIYFFFVIIQMILSFVGYSKMKKIS